MYKLFTKDGVRIVWGAAPGSEAHGEPAAEQKIERLIKIVADHGELRQGAASAPIDLRNAKQPPQISARPAQPNQLRAQ